MSRRPRCQRLRDEANSSNWSEMLVLYCRQASGEDLQMAQQMTALAGRLVGITRVRQLSVIYVVGCVCNYVCAFNFIISVVVVFVLGPYQLIVIYFIQ